MRNLLSVGVIAALALVAVPALGADYPTYPEYPTYDLPEVDTGLVGGFYLRGSVAAASWYAIDGEHCNCVADFDSPGYGYSLGVGMGYETGTGLRADVTLDYLNIDKMTSTSGYDVRLRSGLALANLYYDFQFHDGGGAAGGLGAYVGAGVGFAKNYTQVSLNGAEYAYGSSVEAAGALMAGISYDMGNTVADLGWRGIYMNKVMNQPPDIGDAYLINNNFINELRASIRYRFN